MIGTTGAKLSAEEVVARAVMTDVLTDMTVLLANALRQRQNASYYSQGSQYWSPPRP